MLKFGPRSAGNRTARRRGRVSKKPPRISNYRPMNLRLTMEPVVPQHYEHRPVLARAVVQAFQFRRPAFVIDGTLGLGGHTERLLKHYPSLRVLGLEWDA